MITTKNYRNSNEITITNSATLGKVYGDTYTATITLDISKILNEINRYSNLALKTYLQLKYSSVNYGAAQTLHASYGNIVIFNGAIDTSLSYIILDLTNAISNYTSGAFTINLSLSSYGYDPYTGTMDPYTSYLSIKTENNPQDDTKPIIFFKKADEVHSNYKSKIASLPLSFGGNTLIDLFDSNVKHVVPLFDIDAGPLKMPFSLIYNRLNTITSFIRPNLPVSWTTSLDLSITKSSTFNNTNGDKTIYFYDSLNQMHVLKPVWFYLEGITKCYIDDVSTLYISESQQHYGKICVSIGVDEYLAYVEIVSEDGYRFFSNSIPTDPDTLINYEYDGEYIIDKNSSRYYFSNNKLSKIVSYGKEFQIRVYNTTIYLERLVNNSYTNFSYINTNNTNNVSYYINSNITNVYTITKENSKITNISYNITGGASLSVSFTYSNGYLTKVSNSLTEENNLSYNSYHDLIEFKHRNKINYIDDTFITKSTYNTIESYSVSRYGNKVTLYDSSFNNKYEYFFNADGSILKTESTDLDYNKKSVSSIYGSGEYIKSEVELDINDSYTIYSSSNDMESGDEINYVGASLTNGINTSSFNKLEALLLEIDLSSVQFLSLLSNRLNISIYPYHDSYSNDNVYKTTITALTQGKYYIPFFYKDGDTKIKVEFNYDGTPTLNTIGEIKVYKGDVTYINLTKSFNVARTMNNSGINTILYTYYNKQLITYNEDDSQVSTTMTYSYNNDILVDNIVDNYNNKVEYSYDAFKRVIKEKYSKTTGNKFIEKNYIYDSMGKRLNKSQIMDSNNEYPVESYEYIENTSNVSKYENFKGIKITFTRDTNTFDLLSTSLDITPPYDSTNYTYNKNRLIGLSSYDASNPFMYAYDHKYRRKYITLPNDSEYEYTYVDNYNDSSLSIINGSKVTIAPPIGYSSEFIYDKEGKPKQKTIGNNIVYSYSYDSKNRLSNIDYSSSGYQIESITYSYDSKDRLSMVENEKSDYINVNTEYAYNSDNNLSSITRSVGSSLDESHTEDYSYDNEKRLYGIINDNLIKNMIFYNQCGNVDSIRLYYGPNNNDPSLWRTFEYIGGSYDQNKTTNIINQISNVVSINKYDNHTYEYDTLGNITKETIEEKNGDSSTLKYYYKEYTYDNLNRLIKEKDYGKQIEYTYVYDRYGNVSFKTIDSFDPNDPYTYTKFIYYNNSDWADQLTNDGVFNYTYDYLGRPLNFKNLNIYYDGENRINGIGSNIYYYGVNGLRKHKITQSDTTKYYYDNEGILVKEERSNYPHIVYRYNGSDIIGFSLKTSSNSQYEEYIYSKNIQNDIIRIYKLSDMSLVAEYDYDAYGNQTIITNVNNIADINPFRYRSYYYDTETNLYYLKSRYYSPELMRFLTPDRVSILDDTLTNIDACNLYVYCNNNPVMYSDGDGNLPQWAKYVIGGAFILAGLAATVATGGAFLPALAATAKAVVVSTAISAGIGALAGGISKQSWEGVLEGVLEGAADGFMWGGIFAGTAQLVSAGFKVAANMGVATGRKGGIQLSKNIKILSPNNSKFYENGGTLIKFGNNFRLDVGSKTLLHAYAFGFNHIPIGTSLAILIGGFDAILSL